VTPTSPGDELRQQAGRGDRTALLVVDMLNDYDHPDGDRLRESATSVVPVIGDLLERARAEDVPIVHVNDNHGLWGGAPEALVDRSREVAGAELIDPVAPSEGVPFLFKARHSAFFGSALEYLLQTEGIGRLVVTGQVTEQCIMYTVLDAFIRHFDVVVPHDAVAHIDAELADAALRMMRSNMRAQTPAAAEVDLGPE
jgi:nicotinamidase-related amidase